MLSIIFSIVSFRRKDISSVYRSKGDKSSNIYCRTFFYSNVSIFRIPGNLITVILARSHIYIYVHFLKNIFLYYSSRNGDWENTFSTIYSEKALSSVNKNYYHNSNSSYKFYFSFCLEEN